MSDYSNKLIQLDKKTITILEDVDQIESEMLKHQLDITKDYFCTERLILSLMEIKIKISPASEVITIYSFIDGEYNKLMVRMSSVNLIK